MAIATAACFSPKFDLPAPDPVAQARKANIQCHYCNEQGHKAASCPRLPPGTKLDQLGGQKVGTGCYRGYC